MARKWAPLTILAIVDHAVDVTDVHLSLDVRRESMAALPFSHSGNTWLDLIAKDSYPATAFPDLNGLA